MGEVSLVVLLMILLRFIAFYTLTLATLQADSPKNHSISESEINQDDMPDATVILSSNRLKGNNFDTPDKYIVSGFNTTVKEDIKRLQKKLKRLTKAFGQKSKENQLPLLVESEVENELNSIAKKYKNDSASNTESES